MADQLPAIVVLTPLFAGLLVTLMGLKFRWSSCPIALIATGLTLASTVWLFLNVLEAPGNTISYFLGGWMPIEAEGGRSVPIGIHLSIDTLNGLVLIVIAAVVFLGTIYSLSDIPGKIPNKVPQFYTLLLLLTTGLLGMTITQDAFNVFVLLEVSSLTSYALIAMGPSKRGSVAAFNYVIVGTIGASFFLLGVGYLFAMTGTLNMVDINGVLTSQPALQTSKSIFVAFMLIMMGFWIKMALFPLHGWLPNAYSYSLSSSAAILAPLVTKVSIYVMVRMIITVFGVSYVFPGDAEIQAFTRLPSDMVVWMAVIAILAGSCMALAQTEFRRMLSYLIVVEVGYMVGGVWLANDWGMTGAVYHIISDAFMTLCLFVAAGLFRRQTQAHSITSLDQPLVKKMPFTMAGFVCGAMAIIGIPPTCGFFSKWYLIRGGMESGHWEYVIALLLSSLINAILFFRVIEVLYFGEKPAEVHAHDSHHGDPEDSTPMPLERFGFGQFALLLTAASLFVIGIFNTQIVGWIQAALPEIGN